ncbi:MAG TPA: 16S rRNA (cytidine(1402)-2'-O)-methyltransferase [Actinobacteria bacterium]|nr:16S rRNA (cytidine(1402)-2'-O)-methyltransferase [Actinomycetota bacterium]
MNEEKKGTLYICGTPIGNLEDVSFRLISTLKEADLILAEDTRTIRKLLSRYDIKKKDILSYHQYSDAGKISYIISLLNKGKTAALVSESGMPAIQDPGYRIIGECIEKNISLAIIPGPSASLSALVLSGLPTDSFIFVGFLPKKGEKRKEKIVELSGLPYTLIIYESPNRIERLIGELIARLGNRRAALVREMTKIYEEAIRGDLGQILEEIRSRKIKGEVVLVIEGSKGELIKEYTSEEIEKQFIKLISQGITKKNALKIIKSAYDIDRQKLYNISTKI